MKQDLEKIQHRETIKISQKLSFEEFLQSVTSGTQRIIISNSILEYSKNIRLFIETLRILYTLPILPEIEIIERGKEPKLLKQDWIDPYIRTLIGVEQSSESLLRVKLLDLGAVSKKNPIHISELNKNELKLISILLDKEHIILTKDLKLFLTNIGSTLAKGAKKVYF